MADTTSDRADLIPRRDRDRTVSHSLPNASDGRNGAPNAVVAAGEDDLGLTGCAGSCCCHPKAFCHRLQALILMCLLGFGSYFCFDNPGALQVREQSHKVFRRRIKTCFRYRERSRTPWT